MVIDNVYTSCRSYTIYFCFSRRNNPPAHLLVPQLRYLVTENGQLKLDIRRAEADAALLRAQRNISHTSCPRLDTSSRPPGVLQCDQNDSLGSKEGPHVEIGKVSREGSTVTRLAPNSTSISTRLKDEKCGGVAPTGGVPDAIRGMKGCGLLGTGGDQQAESGNQQAPPKPDCR